jgi:hypothetical protein
MFLPYSIVNPLTTVRIERTLPHPGEVLVRSGDAVEPSHIVAEAVQPADFRIVDVARTLDTSIKKARSGLKIKRGQEVEAGEVLAARGGLSGRVCRAPIAGTVVGSGRGRLLIEAEPESVQVPALVPGVVGDVLAGEGVVIETVGGWIQSAWGNGKLAFGELRLVVRSPRHPLRSSHINASAQGAVLIGGSGLSVDILEDAEEMQVRGMIVGSIQPTLIPRLNEVNFPIIATEGLGDLPMSQAVFELLQSLNGREAAVCGEVGSRWHPKRPYIVIPMPTQAGRAINPEAEIKVGDRVRALRGRHRGRSGIVAAMLTRPIALETGSRLPGITVDFGDDEEADIPYLALERLL